MRCILVACCVLLVVALSIPSADAGGYYGSTYYDGGSYEPAYQDDAYYGGDYYGSRSYWPYSAPYNSGYAYFPTLFGFPIFNSDFPAYDTPCVRHVKVYDDAGGWVWGRRFYC